MIKTALFFLFVFSISVGTQSQSIDTLLTDIEQLQHINNAFYADGLVPSERKQMFFWRQDDNIFFSASTLFILMQNQHLLQPRQKERVNTIRKKIIQNYPAYCQKELNYTCNFWVPLPNEHFPNSLFSRFKKFSIPDDFDDTSLLLATGDFSHQEAVNAAKTMENHVNHKKFTIQSTFKKYRSFEAYSTWFGKNMPIDFDVCVHANVLSFKLEKQLELTPTDTATYQLIEAILTNGDHKKHPEIVAPHYQNTAIILYHLARLCRIDSTDFTATLRPILINELRTAYQQNQFNWDQLLIRNALMMLNQDVVLFDYSQLKENRFRFFIANFTSVNKLWYRRLTEPTGITEAPFRSIALEKAFIIESLALESAYTKENFSK